MKHLMFIAIGALIFALAIGFIVGIGYLGETYGLKIIFGPLFLAMFYALGRTVYEGVIKR